MHQFDQYGIPVTSWTWEDMVECYDDSRKQAEKDLALTWEDIKRIVNIADDILPDPRYKHDLDASLQSEESYYQEVLKRFREGKK